VRAKGGHGDFSITDEINSPKGHCLDQNKGLLMPPLDPKFGSQGGTASQNKSYIPSNKSKDGAENMPKKSPRHQATS
jgi:hypothetical protein